MYIGLAQKFLYGSIATMDDEYTQYELIRGRLYRYDPDMDCWYRAQPDESPISRWAWIVVGIVLAMGAYYAEYLR